MQTMKQKKFNRNVLRSAILIGLFATPSLYAQQTEQASTADAEKPVEKIAVTGSRLKGVDMEGANPLQIFSQDDLIKRGYDSVSAFLRDLPQASSAGTFTENGNVGGSDGPPPGAAGVSLRGLGSSSTLVLINGRRVAVDSFSNGFESFVNVNAIPMSAIERIEVLTDGASSVYGSDAIAGVINFILKKDFIGHEVTVAYGDDTKASDFSRVNFTYAGGFSTDKTNTTLVLDYSDRNRLMNADRPITVTLNSSTRVSVDGRDFAEDWCGTQTSNGGTRCRYNYVKERAIQPDAKTLGATVHHLYRLNDDTELFAEAMLQQNTGHSYDSAGSFDYTISGNLSTIPERFRTENLKDGVVNNIRVRSRFPETRQQEYTANSYRVLAGVRGEYGDWSYESAVTYGKSDNEVIHSQGYYNAAKMRAAVLAGTFDPFNLGRNNSAAQIAALREAAPRIGESEVYSLDFNISGDLFEMPEGAVSAVFGGEFRGEDIFDRPAALAQSGGVTNLGASDAAADRTQSAIYGEFNLPLTAQLDVITALRYDRYSDFGGDVNPKVSFRFRATDDLILRASWSTGFRAPSLSELGAGTSLSTNYINCGTGNPFDALCGDFGAQFGELEIDQETLGNVDLEAENSEAMNVGLSWNLTDELNVTLDYWRYEHTDIVDVDANTTLKACVEGSAPTVSSISALNGAYGCVKDAGNDIVFLRTGFFNVGAQKTDGIDFKMNYKIDTAVGEFKPFFAATRTLSYERQLTTDSPFENKLGILSGANEIGRPDLVADAGLDWRLEQWNAGLSANYKSSVGDGDFKFDNDRVDSWLVLSASAGYDINDQHRLQLSIRNLTDKTPPYASSPTNGYASSMHDWYGRVWNLRYTFQF